MRKRALSRDYRFDSGREGVKYLPGREGGGEKKMLYTRERGRKEDIVEWSNAKTLLSPPAGRRV